MADVKSGDIVVPGDQLCVIEELMPSFGTYESDGVVYAATFGECKIDMRERVIRVVNPDGSMQIALPVKGDIMMGQVTNAYDQRVEVSIVKRNGEDILSPFIGEIHISNVTRRFIKSMLDVMQPGDIIRAVALNTHEIPVQLSVVGPELGVVFAKCRKCGEPLILTTYNNMICPKCEYRETREVASDYGVMFGLEVRPDLAPQRRHYRRTAGGNSRSYPQRGGRRNDRPRYGSQGRSDTRRGGKRSPRHNRGRI